MALSCSALLLKYSCSSPLLRGDTTLFSLGLDLRIAISSVFETPYFLGNAGFYLLADMEFFPVNWFFEGLKAICEI